MSLKSPLNDKIRDSNNDMKAFNNKYPPNCIINEKPTVGNNQSVLSENDNISQDSFSNIKINVLEEHTLNEDDNRPTAEKTSEEPPQNNESKEVFFSDKKKNQEILQRLNLKENLKSIQIVCNEETVNDLHKGNKTEIKNSKIVHDKQYNVNIMKTNKARIFNKYLLNFVILFLQLFNLISTPHIKFKKLNYEEIIHNNNKSDNLSYLNMKIVDFLSIEPFNKRLILKILLKYKDNYNKYVNFIFNMTLRDYIKIFTFKKEIEDNITDLSEEDIAKIKTIFVRADTLLNNEDFSKERIESNDEKKNLGKDDTKSLDNINNKTEREREIDININNNKTEIDITYYSTFVLYLFNFILYYESMKERKRKRNENRKLFKFATK